MNTETRSSSPGPLEQAIHAKLTTLLQPTSIKVTNDSWQHRHHAAMREAGNSNKETHFSVDVVSNAFEKKSTLQRHRMIHSALSEEFATGLHALSLKTKTEAEAMAAAATATATPPTTCPNA
ncbi:bola-domain-containing protein [Pholiota conissans]|uniref:Bola-domain-containing protein n=1 Tax=Pholiota conissans TaxID=109636 RepID=A0A9P5Z6W9_9AGAR|nr:bola-domain-containing protein [Pholiota conissans]